MNFIPEFTKEINGGTQAVYRFENDYGASVIKGGEFAYGGLELAVLKFNGEGNEDYSLTYSTPITDDVLGYMNEQSIETTLQAISKLEK